MLSIIKRSFLQKQDDVFYKLLYKSTMHTTVYSIELSIFFLHNIKNKTLHIHFHVLLHRLSLFTDTTIMVITKYLLLGLE